jgi:hypothetical protein
LVVDILEEVGSQGEVHNLGEEEGNHLVAGSPGVDMVDVQEEGDSNQGEEQHLGEEEGNHLVAGSLVGRALHSLEQHLEHHTLASYWVAIRLAFLLEQVEQLDQGDETLKKNPSEKGEDGWMWGKELPGASPKPVAWACRALQSKERMSAKGRGEKKIGLLEKILLFSLSGKDKIFALALELLQNLLEVGVELKKKKKHRSKDEQPKKKPCTELRSNLNSLSAIRSQRRKKKKARVKHQKGNKRKEVVACLPQVVFEFTKDLEGVVQCLENFFSVSVLRKRLLHCDELRVVFLKHKAGKIPFSSRNEKKKRT